MASREEYERAPSKPTLEPSEDFKSLGAQENRAFGRLFLDVKGLSGLGDGEVGSAAPWRMSGRWCRRPFRHVGLDFKW